MTLPSSTSAAPAPDPRAPAPGDEAALALHGVECRYGRRVILRDVSFSVAPGEIFFIAGPSGGGKSTLLKNIIGLIPPAAGRIEIFGRDITAATPEERRDIQALFGVLYQNGALWSSMTVAENIELPLELFTDLSPADRHALAELKLAQVGLAGAASKRPAELSGGMRKRAALARALALDPHLVFFDEPTAGLDPITGRQLDDLVCELRDNLGTTMVIVSHELESIFGIADRIAFLDGQTQTLVALGPPTELREHAEPATVREFLTRSEKSRDARA